MYISYSGYLYNLVSFTIQLTRNLGRVVLGDCYILDPEDAEMTQTFIQWMGQQRQISHIWCLGRMAKGLNSSGTFCSPSCIRLLQDTQGSHISYLVTQSSHVSKCPEGCCGCKTSTPASEVSESHFLPHPVGQITKANSDSKEVKLDSSSQWQKQQLTSSHCQSTALIPVNLSHRVI